MSDRDQIEQLLHDYAWSNDAADIDLLRATFAEDVRYAISIAGQPAVGPFTSRDETVAFVAAAVSDSPVQRRHVVTNLRVLDAEVDRASLVAYVTIVQTEDGALRPVAAGVYRADVRREARGWVLASLSIELDGAF
ncbi:MAG: nuclear transport factor 2 family protein [Patulibacter sp.]|nr:nuclear transport factor 2 family protein [Patulibacter sp.]